MLLSLTFLLLLLRNAKAAAFQTISYAYEPSITSPQYMSQDISKIVAYGTSSGSLFPIQIYAVNDKNMTLISQPYLKTCATLRCSGNTERLLCIDATMTILRLYNVTGYDISFIQEIVLGSALGSFYSVSFSFDGNILVVSENTRTFAMVY